MARYQLLMAVSEGAQHYQAGSTIADSQANALALDVVSAFWTAAHRLSVNLVPLDASAVAAMQGAGFTTNGAGQRVSGAPCTITGAASIDA